MADTRAAVDRGEDVTDVGHGRMSGHAKRLAAAVEAGMAAGARWAAEAGRAGALAEASIDLGQPVASAAMSYRAQALADCARELREAVSAALSGEDGPELQQPARPPVVCLCGSTRFREDFERVGRERTLAGEIVLTVNDFDAYGGPERGQQDVPAGEKAAADELHRRKIDMAGYVYVINPGGYIGESTRGEIAYAREQGKAVTYMEAPGE